ASPGHRVVVLDDEQNELAPGIPGELAVDLDASPLCWFQGYKGMDTDAFKGKYYLTGDTVELNEDGSISFVGRADDVIVTSGYRVGPFEVESALVEHEAVMEAAVVGKPDAKRGEIIKAVVVLNADYKVCTELQEALQDHVKVRLAAHAFPREVEFVDSLPKTPSGKYSALFCVTKLLTKWRKQTKIGRIMQLQDNTFVITGGASGLGAATADYFVQQGANV